VIWVCQVVLTATQMRVKCLVDQSRQGAHEVGFSIPSSDLVGCVNFVCVSATQMRARPHLRGDVTNQDGITKFEEFSSPTLLIRRPSPVRLTVWLYPLIDEQLLAAPTM